MKLKNIIIALVAIISCCTAGIMDAIHAPKKIGRPEAREAKRYSNRQWVGANAQARAAQAQGAAQANARPAAPAQQQAAPAQANARPSAPAQANNPQNVPAQQQAPAAPVQAEPQAPQIPSRPSLEEQINEAKRNLKRQLEMKMQPYDATAVLRALEEELALEKELAANAPAPQAPAVVPAQTQPEEIIKVEPTGEITVEIPAKVEPAEPQAPVEIIAPAEEPKTSEQIPAEKIKLEEQTPVAPQKEEGPTAKPEEEKEKPTEEIPLAEVPVIPASPKEIVAEIKPDGEVKVTEQLPAQAEIKPEISATRPTSEMLLKRIEEIRKKEAAKLEKEQAPVVPQKEEEPVAKPEEEKKAEPTDQPAEGEQSGEESPKTIGEALTSAMDKINTNLPIEGDKSPIRRTGSGNLEDILKKAYANKNLPQEENKNLEESQNWAELSQVMRDREEDISKLKKEKEAEEEQKSAKKALLPEVTLNTDNSIIIKDDGQEVTLPTDNDPDKNKAVINYFENATSKRIVQLASAINEKTATSFPTKKSLLDSLYNLANTNILTDKALANIRSLYKQILNTLIEGSLDKDNYKSLLQKLPESLQEQEEVLKTLIGRNESAKKMQELALLKILRTQKDQDEDEGWDEEETKEQKEKREQEENQRNAIIQRIKDLDKEISDNKNKLEDLKKNG